MWFSSICMLYLYFCVCIHTSDCNTTACLCAVSKNNLSVANPPPTPFTSLFVSLHFMVGSLSILLSAYPLCSLFDSSPPLPHLASLPVHLGLIELCLRVGFGIETAWNTSPPCFHWPIIPFPIGLKGPSVRDNLRVQEEDGEEMRERVRFLFSMLFAWVFVPTICHIICSYILLAFLPSLPLCHIDNNSVSTESTPLNCDSIFPVFTYLGKTTDSWDEDKVFLSFYFSSKLFIILIFKPAQYCVGTLCTAALFHRGMDFIRPLKVSCGFRPQHLYSRCFWVLHTCR